jgi:PAS domain S-box-containing protein
MTSETGSLEQKVHLLEMEIQRLRRVTLDLRESEDFSRALFQATQTGMLIIQKETGQIRDANLAAAEILGGDVGDLVGNLVQEVMALSEGGLAHFWAAAGNQQNAPGEMVHLEGHGIPVLRSITHLSGNNEGIILLGFLDITARKNAENELRASHQQLTQAMEELKQHKNRIVQSEKLASIGQLAAGVAHEINNPVGYVTSNLGTLSEYAETMKDALVLYHQLMQLPPDREAERRVLLQQIGQIREDEDLEFILEDVDKVMTESMEGVHRVAEIVQNLKSFAREDSAQKSLHNVNEGVEAMIKVVWNELKYRCTVETDLGNIPDVEGHGGQINQVIMNMLVNAAQAMPEEGGVLSVTTRQESGEVVITIADNGRGMDATTLNRIFDPFFTTKEVGKGTGLGLSISHGIIHDHGGRIEVESEPGRGTTFSIHLPACLEAPPPASRPEEELIG